MESKENQIIKDILIILETKTDNTNQMIEVKCRNLAATKQKKYIEELSILIAAFKHYKEIQDEISVLLNDYGFVLNEEEK